MIPATYARVWCIDFEFSHQPGGLPLPLCMVAREVRSQELVRVWLADGVQSCPIPFNKSDLIVAYYASAEVSCFLELGWSIPAVLDLYAEFRWLTCGETVPHGRGLLGAMLFHNLPTIGAEHKAEMRELALRGGPYSEAEKIDLLDYCQSDVDGLALLLREMAHKVDWPRAVGIRGRYMIAVARMEKVGIPIDSKTLTKMIKNWEELKTDLVQAVDPDGEVYEWKNNHFVFKQDRFALMLKRMNIPWPKSDAGKLLLDEDTFRGMARCLGGKIALIHDLRRALAEMKLNSLEVGADERNRCMLSPFASKTGRNQPSNAKFIFGAASWLRGLIQPKKGRALAYVDWSQQEFGIAAYLSGDAKMQEAYLSGDPYLAFAKQAGAVPPDGTKETHGDIRNQYKTCVLGVQYGIGAAGLGVRLGLGECWANHLLKMHKRTFQEFWAWSDRVEAWGMLRGELESPFGWRCSFHKDPNPRSIRNWPMQSAGAEMMRLAAIYATEAGLAVCCPVHDAFLIEANTKDISEAVARMQQVMRKASEVTLPGFPLRSDANVIRYPERFGAGAPMWDRVQGLLAKLSKRKSVAV